ncbi:hypothetical protein Tco_1146400, partial [Tanacetum coccineum]
VRKNIFSETYQEVRESSSGCRNRERASQQNQISFQVRPESIADQTIATNGAAPKSLDTQLALATFGASETQNRGCTQSTSRRGIRDVIRTVSKEEVNLLRDAVHDIAMSPGLRALNWFCSQDLTINKSGKLSMFVSVSIELSLAANQSSKDYAETNLSLLWAWILDNAHR